MERCADLRQHGHVSLGLAEGCMRRVDSVTGACAGVAACSVRPLCTNLNKVLHKMSYALLMLLLI